MLIVQGKRICYTVDMKRDRIRKTIWLRLVLSAALLAFCVIAIFLTRRFPAAAAQYYTPFSKAVSGALGKLFSIFPFSVAELLLYALLLAVPASLILLFCRLLRRGGLHSLADFFSWWMLTIAGIAAAYFLFWGLNYYTPPVTEQLGMETQAYGLEELTDAAAYYIEQMNVYAAKVRRLPDGTADLGSFKQLSLQSCAAMERLGQQYPRLNGLYSPAKAVMLSGLMQKTAISGVYSPFTGECNVNPNMPVVELPFTMAHELSHRVAVTQENEANYIAFLACEGASEPELRYSGYYFAFVYCYNAVAKQDREKQAALYDMIDEAVLADIAAVREDRAQNDGALNEVTERINDSYLKAMNQQDGVQSYGKVVDLLIAHYLDIQEQIQ